MLAGAKLMRRLGGVVIEVAAVIDLPDLGGSKILRDNGIDVFSLTSFGGH